MRLGTLRHRELRAALVHATHKTTANADRRNLLHRTPYGQKIEYTIYLNAATRSALFRDNSKFRRGHQA